MRSISCLSVVVAIAACLVGPVSTLMAADPSFVGILAVAVDPEVSAQLGLTEDVRTKLIDVIDERESAALELVLSLKEATPDERAAKLTPFAAESEKLGLALLNDDQRAKLAQIRINRAGLSSLAEEEVATKLALTAEQRAEITKLMADLTSSSTQASETQRRIAKAFYERKLAALLTDEQRASWEAMAGIAPGAPTDPAAPMPTAPVAGSPTTPAPMPTTPMPGDPTDAPAVAGTDPMPSTPSAGAPGAPSAEMPAVGPVAPAAPPKVAGDGKLRFNFRYAPWKDVLDWFASQADLSLTMEAPPQGTFNYSDTRSYTPAEAIDLINSVLLTKGFTLIRRERMLLLVNLEDGIPPSWVPQVTLEALESKGEFELVSCLFQLTKLTSEEADAEVRKLLGPQGSMVLLSKAKQIYVTETAGKLRVIRKVLDAIENPAVPTDEKIVVVTLKHASPTEFLILARQLLGIPDGALSTPDASIRLGVDELGGRIFVTGKAERLAKVDEIVQLIDVPADAVAAGGVVAEQPQLEVYSVTQADPAAVLQVMQTLLAGLPDVRLTTDPKTGNLVALAKPSEHATIRATLDQLQRDGTQIDVIQLRKVDPSAAVLAINKLFGGGDEKSGNAGPKVDADPINMQLMIRGTTGQVTQIRDLLTKMGELGEETLDGALVDRENVRILPITGRAATNALSQLQMVWPTMHQNKIRVVTQSELQGGTQSPTTLPPAGFQQPGGADLDPLMQLESYFQQYAPRPAPAPPAPGQSAPVRPVPAPPAPVQPAPAPSTQPAAPALPSVEPTSTEASRQSRGDFFVYQPAAGGTTPATPAAPAIAAPPATNAPVAETPAPGTTGPATTTTTLVDPKKGSEIVVTVGPGGIMIASEDLDALDDFEQLLQTIADTTATTGTEFNIYYLKYAKAEIAAALLTEIMGGASAGGGDAGGGGGGLMGDLASSMLGDVGGGLLGGLLGGGGGGGGLMSSSTSGTVTVTADPRLNALVIQASPRDLDSVEQLLKVIDQPASPEAVQTVTPPRFIPVFNTSAESVATIVKQAYSGRIAGDAAGGQQRQPSPEDFIRALRGGGGGGRGGRGGGGEASKGEEQKMTVSFDARTNSLIVSAPDYLFEEVKLLVQELDTATVNSDETVRIVTIKKANPDLLQRSLSSMLGPNVTTNKTTAAGTTTGSRTSSASSSRGSTTQQFQPQNDQFQEQMRQRVEMFNNIQRAMQDGGGGGRGGPPGGGGGFPGGGFPGGGGGGFPGGGGGRGGGRGR